MKPGSDPLDAPDLRTTDVDFAVMARALWGRKIAIIVPVLLALIGSAVAVSLVPPEYKATASILLQPQETAFTRPIAAQQQQDQAAIDEQAVGSQVQLLKSREVAHQAIRDLNLVGNAEFDPLASGERPLQHLLSLIGLGPEASGDTPEERVLPRYFAALSVYPMDKSRVVTVEFASRDPELAARAANAIADIYVEMQRTAKRGESQDASEALSPQIAALRDKVSQAEAAVEAYRAKNGLFIAQNNATLSTQQLADITGQLSAAQAEQAQAQAKADLIRDTIRSGRPVEVSDIANNELIRRLVEQRVGLSAQLAQELQTLLPGHPRIKELKAQLAGLQAQIASEAEKAARALETDAALAKARVASLSARLDQQKTASAAANGSEVELHALEREAKAQRDLLESYLSRYREASARASFQELPADARIISRAVPAAEPYFPKKGPIITIATLAALVLSLATLVTMELMSGRALVPREPALPIGAELRPVQRLPAIADAPAAPPAPPPPVPQPPIPAAPPTMAPPRPAPDVPAVLAELLVRLRQPAGHAHVVLVAGSGRRGPISETATELARLLSAQGRRSMLVDLVPATRASGGLGLGDLLTGATSFAEVIGRDDYSRLHLIGAGSPLQGIAPELVVSRLRVVVHALSLTYDAVVLDGGSVSADSPLPAWAELLGGCELALAIGPPEEAKRLADLVGRLRDRGLPEGLVALVETGELAAA